MSSEHDTSHSFTDLMTSLAVIFILLLVATLNNAFSDSENAIQDLRKEVTEELKALDLVLTTDPNDPYTQTINLNEDKVKFDFNSDVLKPEGRDFIYRLFEVLSSKLCDKKIFDKLESVIIEGHTDSVGNRTIEGKLHNVKLSQDRAYSVMSEAMVSVERKNKNYADCLNRLASATGRGSNRPLAGHIDEDNRRVEIKIRVRNNHDVQHILKLGEP